MLYKGLEVRLIGGHENGNIEICIFLKTQSKIIGLSENLYSVRHIANSANQFLKGSTCSSSTAHFPIEASSNHETNSQLVASLLIASGN